MDVDEEVANEDSDDLETECDDSKGQLISKGLFGVIVLTKKPTNFLMISALGSNKSSNQKNFIV